MNAAQRRANEAAAQYTKYEFPVNKENQKYEAKIHFTAREVLSFDVNFLFDIAESLTEITSADDAITKAEKLKQAKADAAAVRFTVRLLASKIALIVPLTASK